MCRRIIFCFLCCVLLCCSCLGVAMADDVPGDDTFAVDEFLRDLGFDADDEDEVSLFLNWLLPLEPSSEHDMALILSGSEYSELDSEKVYFFWKCLQESVGDTDLLFSGDGTGGVVFGSAYGYIRWSPDDPSKILISSRLPNSAFDSNPPVVGTIDLASITAQQGYLTQASLTPLENWASLIYDRLGLVNSTLGDVLYTQLVNANTALGLLHTDSVLSYNRLGLMANDLDSLLNVANDMYYVLRGNLDGNIWSFLQTINSNISYMRNTQFPQLFSFSRSWSFDAASNSIKSAAAKSLGIAELLDVNFKDLDSLLLKNFGYSPGVVGGLMAFVPPGSGVLPYLASMVEVVDSGLFSYESFLSASGNVEFPIGFTSLSDISANGFIGLNTNMEKVLVGGHDGSAQYSRLTFDDKLYKNTDTVNYTDLLHAMVGIGSDIQNPLSQLQAVLAGDSDLELHRNTQENIDSVTDNFTGDGSGSVSSTDISDASGLTAGIGDAFGGNQVSTGDFFSVAGDSANWDFFSEESARSLDAVTYPAAAVLDVEDDSWLDDFVADENGFYSVADQSGWSFLDYLGKEG